MLNQDELVESTELLGAGAFGEVREGTYCGIPVAIKTLRDRPLTHPPRNRNTLALSLALFEAEVKLLDSMHHPNLVSMLASDMRTKKMVLDKYDSDASSLRDYKDVIVVGRDCMRAIYYMHMHGNCMRHGDIKPENILVMRDINGGVSKAALGDMGLARACTETVYTGTLGYMPLIINSVDRMHDIFALAVSILNSSNTNDVHGSRETYNTISEYPPPGDEPDSLDNTMFFAALLHPDVQRPVAQMLALVYNPGRNEEDKRSVIVRVLEQWDALFEAMVGVLKRQALSPPPRKSRGYITPPTQHMDISLDEQNVHFF